MRPIKSGLEIGEGNLMKKQSLAPAVHALWDAWEIHCVILTSLFLQVFLFFTAGMRRRSTSWVLRTLLWLAYLSADTVAIFVLGHLAVHASAPHHELMFFWAPFVLVHLGGQDTITAFSRQDNELWKRHLLSLVTQVTLAGYVVAKASWTDGRLWAATMLVFVSGCFKYTERTLCLYLASSGWLRSDSLGFLSRTLRAMFKEEPPTLPEPFTSWMGSILRMKGGHTRIGDENWLDTVFNLRWEGSLRGVPTGGIISDIMSVDAPRSTFRFALIQVTIEKRPFEADCEYVGACLVRCYHRLYTKIPLRQSLFERMINCHSCHVTTFPIRILLMLYITFLYASTPTALVLFTVAMRGDYRRRSPSRADIIVSYILLVGAVALDVSSVIISICSHLRFNLPPGSPIRSAMRRVANYIQPQWSQNLAQYSVAKRHVVQTGTCYSIQLWIGKRLSAWGIELFDTTHTSISSHPTSIKRFIVNDVLDHGQRHQWDITSSRGQRALHRHRNIWPKNALLKSTSSVDFPTSVLLWHIATYMCHHCGHDTSNSFGEQEVKMYKQVSRELSNYIMYLVYKCNVMLTPDAQILHDKAHDEIREILQDQQLGEEDAAKKLFKGKKKEEKQDIFETLPYYQRWIEGNWQDDEAITGPGATDEGMIVMKLRQRYSPVLPRARNVAQELLSVDSEIERWGLITKVWAEMLYYAVPRCGGSFHYEHLSTGGEFATHILVLMYSLGPFLPTPGT